MEQMIDTGMFSVTTCTVTLARNMYVSYMIYHHTQVLNMTNTCRCFAEGMALPVVIWISRTTKKLKKIKIKN